MHFVMTKSCFLLLLALCLVFQQPHYSAAEDSMAQNANKDSLIQKACKVTSSPPLCSTALDVLANSPSLNPNDITITVVQAAAKAAKLAHMT